MDLFNLYELKCPLSIIKGATIGENIHIHMGTILKKNTLFSNLGTLSCIIITIFLPI